MIIKNDLLYRTYQEQMPHFSKSKLRWHLEINRAYPGHVQRIKYLEPFTSSLYRLNNKDDKIKLDRISPKKSIVVIFSTWLVGIFFS